jgi:hypothetical protein
LPAEQPAKVDGDAETRQVGYQDQLVSEVMQEQTDDQHDCDPNNQPVLSASPERGLLVGCCLFALLMGWIGTGRAPEPPTPQITSQITSQIAAQNLTFATRAVTTRLIPNPPSDGTTGSATSAPLAQNVTQADTSTAGATDDVAPLPAPLFAQATPAADMTMDIFLDRLMRAESGGKLTARSGTSTALGPFQFIDATFLIVVRRHFAAETAALTPSQILALRTDMVFSRRAAEAFTKDNASLLVGAGIPATFQNLRLAYLLGPGGAIKVLQTDPAMPLPTLLSANVIRANAFMRPLTVSGLIARAAREVAVKPTSVAGIVAPPAAATDVAAAVATIAAANSTVAGAVNAKIAAAVPRAPPTIVVSCDLGLASCRKWLALEQRRQGNRNRGVREARAR